LFLPKVEAQVAQPFSGTWDAAFTTGTTGYINHGNGVIQFLDKDLDGCQGGAVHETSSKYDPSLGAAFSKCYNVFFGCPGSDEIGSDTKGDGMAFSFSKCGFNIGTCGGGLGYNGGCGQMITVEFDTYSSIGNNGFDGTYGGGITGNRDEVAIHRDGIASDAGRLTSADAGNLEDGLEHVVCITYTPGTRIISISIDGSTKLSYDLGPTYNLQTYFGAGGLNQTWSSGKEGATNPSTVSDANLADISNNLGGASLCPSTVVVSSTSVGCSGEVILNATVSPPTGNTVDYVEFFVDNVSIGTDNTSTYSISTFPTTGSHTVRATAHYIPSGTSSTSANVNVTVGGSTNVVELTSTAPTIGGVVDAVWASYDTYNLDKAGGGITAPDLDGTFKVMYDATYLYVLVDVTDDDRQNDGGNPWENDGPEIFIDIGNDKAGAYGANDYQYNFLWNSTTPIEHKRSAFGSLTGVSYGFINRAGGYTIEARIPWSSLTGGGAPAAGTSLGFDVKINDDDGGGVREHEIAWNDGPGSFTGHANPGVFGTLQMSGCDPLPVELLSFSASEVNDYVLLKWVTLSELNNQKFIIERSSSKGDWVAIGNVAGAQNSITLNNYNFTDHAPLDGIVYYRLRQEDKDGKYSNSNVVAISFDQNIIVMPNPFDNVLTITGNLNGETDIKIHDVLGRLVYQETRTIEDDFFQIQPDLPTATYFITIQTDTLVVNKKIIKK
jgi:hypothetical protein